MPYLSLLMRTFTEPDNSQGYQFRIVQHATAAVPPQQLAAVPPPQLPFAALATLRVSTGAIAHARASFAADATRLGVMQHAHATSARTISRVSSDAMLPNLAPALLTEARRLCTIGYPLGPIIVQLDALASAIASIAQIPGVAALYAFVHRHTFALVWGRYLESRYQYRLARLPHLLRENVWVESFGAVATFLFADALRRRGLPRSLALNWLL